MIPARRLCPIVLLLLLPLPAGAKAPRPRKWKEFGSGWVVTTREGVMRTTLDRKTGARMAARIAELRPFFEKHFQVKLKKKWSYTLLADFKEYNRYAKEFTKGRTNVQGQCLRARREIVVCNSKRYGWVTTLSHEYAHAYYDCRGPIWLREGIASLAEVTARKGRKTTIPVNPPRLRGLRLYQRKGHYKSIVNLVQGKREADGYGYSYEHGWSVHYFLYRRDARQYRAFLKAVRRSTRRDLSPELKKHFGLDVKALDRAWAAYMKKVK